MDSTVKSLRGPMMQQCYNCSQSCIRVLCPDVFVVYFPTTLCVWAFLWDLIGQLVPVDSANRKPHKFSLGTSYISVKMAFHLLHNPTHIERNTVGGDAICRNVQIRSVYKSSHRRDCIDHYSVQVSTPFPSECMSMKMKYAHIEGSE